MSMIKGCSGFKIQTIKVVSEDVNEKELTANCFLEALKPNKILNKTKRMIMVNTRKKKIEIYSWTSGEIVSKYQSYKFGEICDSDSHNIENHYLVCLMVIKMFEDERYKEEKVDGVVASDSTMDILISEMSKINKKKNQKQDEEMRERLDRSEYFTMVITASTSKKYSNQRWKNMKAKFDANVAKIILTVGIVWLLAQYTVSMKLLIVAYQSDILWLKVLCASLLLEGCVESIFIIIHYTSFEIIDLIKIGEVQVQFKRQEDGAPKLSTGMFLILVKVTGVLLISLLLSCYCLYGSRKSF